MLILKVKRSKEMNKNNKYNKSLSTLDIGEYVGLEVKRINLIIGWFITKFNKNI